MGRILVETCRTGWSAPSMVTFIRDIPRNAFIGVVKLYQLVISPHLGASCRFRPTCSEYAIQALRTYGAVKGFIMATHRILRCNPWGGHGYDPPRWFTEHPEEKSSSVEPD